MTGNVRKPLDEYQSAQERNKAINKRGHATRDSSMSVNSTAPSTMPIATPKSMYEQRIMSSTSYKLDRKKANLPPEYM